MAAFARLLRASASRWRRYEKESFLDCGYSVLRCYPDRLFHRLVYRKVTPITGGKIKKNFFWVVVVLLYAVVLAGCSVGWSVGK